MHRVTPFMSAEIPLKLSFCDVGRSDKQMLDVAFVMYGHSMLQLIKGFAQAGTDEYGFV